ncbi:MAG: imidazole glycerol phosphate synthase subunit HisH [Acidimicrobiia bacterium]
MTELGGPPDRGDRPIAVLDYGIGNLRSAEKALQYLGARASLTSDPAVARRAAGVVLPGVGAFGRCMAALRESGLEPVVREAVEDGRPFLGICVGLQMLFDSSEESPEISGLGLVGGVVRRLVPGVPGLKVPHMGWTRVEVTGGSALFSDLPERPFVYFVHSYAPVPEDEDCVAARADHGGSLVAAVERGALWGTQFHPEKSGANGLALLSNFVTACQAA